MTRFSRADRVGGLIQQMLSDLLHKDISDPRLQMATITHVKVTKDLRLARIFFAAAGGKAVSEQTAQGFRSAAAGCVGTGNIWRSTNSGATIGGWVDVALDPSDETDFDFITHLGSGYVIASTYPNSNLFRSTDYGVTWASLGRFGTSIEGAMHEIASIGGGHGIAGNGDGHPWRTADYGAT